MLKKVLFIVPNLPDNAPYLSNYFDVFDRLEVLYDIICWNRNNRPKWSNNQVCAGYCYNNSGSDENNFQRKILDFFGFARFAKSILLKNSYDYLIVCNIAVGLFLFKTLTTNFKNRYILDIRDYSPLMKYFAGKVAELVECAALNVISSTAYLSWLPRNSVYVVSHNVSKLDLLNSLRMSVRSHDVSFNEPIKILTIGQIRDFSANQILIRNFGLNAKFRLLFSGDGIEKHRLQLFVQNENYDNCLFSGRYDKSEEQFLVENCDFINILLPEKDFIMTQMTNRFYLGLIYRRPIIVNKRSCQSSFVIKYKLGLSLELSDNYELGINNYVNNFDQVEFDTGINRIIAEILEEINVFERSIVNLFNTN
jgi:hypothetical protein